MSNPSWYEIMDVRMIIVLVIVQTSTTVMVFFFKHVLQNVFLGSLGFS